MLKLGKIPFEEEAKLQALIILLKLYSGESPIIERYDNYVTVNFTPNQIILLQDILKKWHDLEPGSIRINVKSVLFPFYVKKYGIFLIIILIAGILIGSVVRKK